VTKVAGALWRNQLIAQNPQSNFSFFLKIMWRSQLEELIERAAQEERD
jgi:hypothetical protein